ncbi:MAG: hypothetical protein IT285_08410 [Bdellovibrionales bacterium]|nr:hypothetical protein [Bdellovibrionales bacterium]
MNKQFSLKALFALVLIAASISSGSVLACGGTNDSSDSNPPPDATGTGPGTGGGAGGANP